MNAQLLLLLAYTAVGYVSSLELSICVDNSVDVWADGRNLGSHSGWGDALRVSMSANTGILSFQAHSSGVPAGVLASLDNGMITNSDWRCTTSASGTAWQRAGFDDSSWQPATEYGTNGVSPWGLNTRVAAGARWIWTSNNEAVGYIHCRIRIGIEVLGTCDNTIWIYADGTDYTTSSSSSSNTIWEISEYYILPRNSSVLGIKCQNVGSVAGILASVYNGPVTDVYEWKCTHTPGAGWSTLGYDDSSWNIPQFLGDHGVRPWGVLRAPYQISMRADWIWTQSRSDDMSRPIAYCRVNLATPNTCWDNYEGQNAVYGLITSPGTQRRPSTFYFGVYGDDVQGCADACARDSLCHAFTLVPSNHGNGYAGHCYGRSSSTNTMVAQANIYSGVKISCNAIPSTGQTITQCTGLPNGNYQSSESCNAYVTCQYGVATVNHCPENQYWDDELDRCDFVTATCTDACSVGPCQHGGTCGYTEGSYTCRCSPNVEGDNCETVVIPTGECVEDCDGVADGNYQSCVSCTVYARCANGVLQDNIACDSGLFWDDIQGTCVEDSQTCQDYCLVTSRSQCSSDGQGQSTCENLGCCWDTSATPNCFHSSEPPRATSTAVTCGIPVTERAECGFYGIGRDECLGYGCCWYTHDAGPWCYDSHTPRTIEVGELVTDCMGAPNGNYQSGTNCNEYIVCLENELHTGHCPAGEYWDDSINDCTTSGSTCTDICTNQPCSNGGTCGYEGESYSCSCPPEYTGSECELSVIPSGQPVDDCANVEDGSYHASSNCNAYVICSGGSLTSHQCPVGQLWDDDSSTCGASTSTCTDACTVSPCQNGATCGYTGDTLSCSCAEGFDGSACEYIFVAPGEVVIDCTGLENRGYHSDTNCNEYTVCTDGEISTAHCDEGMFWDDNNRECSSSTDTCSDVCTAVPCLNGGTCNYQDDFFNCTCAEDFTGSTCEEEIQNGNQDNTAGSQGVAIGGAVGGGVAGAAAAGAGIAAAVRRFRKKKQNDDAENREEMPENEYDGHVGNQPPTQNSFPQRVIRAW